MATSQKLGGAELLYRCAEQMGLQPSWVTPNGLFVIVTGAGEKYVNLGVSPLNTQVGASLSKNKYFARLIMERHNLPNIPFARPRTDAQAKAFLDEHTTIIVKPVSGAGAQDIHIVRDMSELESIDIRKYIFEKYITGKEMRYLVLADSVIAVHESEYGTSVEETRALQRISYSQDDWDPALIDLSTRIASILGLKFAAVDYLVDAQNRVYILEVNSAPGLKWFHAPTSGPPVDVAAMFLRALLADPANINTSPSLRQ
ncbi:MAG: ATP-grasp domain-containing protein [Patescibacteria group bacterium]